MNAPIEDQLHGFATTLLERRGALVEWPATQRRGTALLPSEVAGELGAGEVAPLGPDVTSDGLSVNLAGDFLQWSGRLLEAEPRIGVFRVCDPYLKRKELEDSVGRVFTWLNAKVKIREVRETTIEYHTWWFHGVLTSDDRWETQFQVSINSALEVEVSIPDPLGLWELQPQPAASPTPASYPQALAIARRRVLSAASDFLGRMDSRLQRDRKRLHDYYHALLRESNKKKTRGHQPPDPEKTEAANRAVKLELSRKLVELDDRYATTATVAPVILVRTETPVIAVDLIVHRKQAHKNHTVYWNPLVKQFDPLRCNRCGQGTFGVAFSNDDVQPRCAGCESREHGRSVV